MAAGGDSKKVTYALIWAAIWILCSSSSSCPSRAAAVATQDNDNPYAKLSSSNDGSLIEAVGKPLPPPPTGSETPVLRDEDDAPIPWWVEPLFIAGDVFFFVASGSVVVCIIGWILKSAHKECGKGVPVTV
ncbi:unnamed protein product [Linum tenue]|uniref:Uncharacterized protein n=1 Tax=Linum tenue TaxID=586396 RepID=A0AAV0RCP8_9ROSI|nr:unnamed protein product [Linum tenue]